MKIFESIGSVTCFISILGGMEIGRGITKRFKLYKTKIGKLLGITPKVFLSESSLVFSFTLP